MDKKALQAEFHRRIAGHLPKRLQGIVMGEFRAVLDEHFSTQAERAQQVAQAIEDNHERIYGNRDGE